MGARCKVCAAAAALFLTGAAAPSMNDILAHSPKMDWRAIEPANTLVIALPRGRLTIELAPGFAPNTIANIKALVHAHYFDGSFVVRAQDNYVVQWARVDSRPPSLAKRTIAPEFDRPAAGVPFGALADPDTYARETGFSSGFPVARDSANGRIWLAHCYGMVGVGRDVPADSGNGSELYAVIGQSPRNLDRNVALVGRVIDGIALLSGMPRGTGALGFYEKPEQRIPIKWIRLGNELPAAEQPKFDALKTDSPSFARVLDERRTRPDPWYKHSPGRINLCNIPLAVRVRQPR